MVKGIINHCVSVVSLCRYIWKFILLACPFIFVLYFIIQGIIEPVIGHSRWVSPLVIVPKADDIRVCVDMRLANKAIIREKHPIPTMEDLLPNLRNSKFFSKLDIRNAFHQLEISEGSRHITTFITKQGLFRYKRLMFGISCAPEIFQKVMEKLLIGCDGCIVYIDDILIFAIDENEHDRRLKQVLIRLRDAGVKLNREKSEIKVKSIVFLGHVLNEQGIKPSEDRIHSIRNFRRPSTVEETRSFLGLINYVGRFIPNLSTLAEPLYRIIKQSNEFIWGKDQDEAFEIIKTKMSSIDYLGYYCPFDETYIIADASPVGLGAVITQTSGNQSRIIAFANKTLTDVERRYCQTEKEALAIVWAVERFHIYLFGKHFNLLTDHKPLQAIFGPRSKPSARIERWVLRLQSYDYTVVHIPGKSNIADPLSRLCITQKHPSFDDHMEHYIHQLTTYSLPIAVSYSEMKTCSTEDQEIQKVTNALKTDIWPADLIRYKIIKDELALTDGILIRGSRIVVPKSMRNRVLCLGHEGHPGMSVMKSRLRAKIWWPRIDRDVEQHVKGCKGCLQVTLPPPPEPMKRRNLPNKPWKDLSIDYLGPLPSGHYIFVVIDYFSKYFEIKIMTSITTKCTIVELREIFSRFGIPLSITADNGPQFRVINREFRNFCNQFGIVLYNTTPEWPQQNGQVERQNRSLLKRLRISQIEGSDWRADLMDYLLMYRSTPHSELGKTPSELLFGWNIRDKIPHLGNQNNAHVYEEIADIDKFQKEKGKIYADQKRKAKVSSTEVGDTVLLKKQRINKLSPNFGNEEFRVTGKRGSELEVQSKCDGRFLTRNSSHTLKIGNDHKEDDINAEVDPNDEMDNSVEVDNAEIDNGSNYEHEVLTGDISPHSIHHQTDEEFESPIVENEHLILENGNNGHNEAIEGNLCDNPEITENHLEKHLNQKNSRPIRTRRPPIKYNDFILNSNTIFS